MTDKAKVRDLIIKAHTHATAGKRERALSLIREALDLDPEEMVITGTILSLEEGGGPAPKKSPPRVAKPVRHPERTDPMAIDPKLEKALDLSEKCRSKGDNAKALAYLKKAKTLFPDSSLVEERLSSLTIALKAENFLRMARKSLDDREAARAVKAARKAFETFPGVQGLGEVLDEIESLSRASGEVEFTGDYRHDIDLEDEDGSAEDYGDYEDESSDSVDDLIERIRQLVREDQWDEAAVLVEQGVSDYPGNELLETFKVKFKRLGFLG